MAGQDWRSHDCDFCELDIARIHVFERRLPTVSGIVLHQLPESRYIYMVRPLKLKLRFHSVKSNFSADVERGKDNGCDLRVAFRDRRSGLPPREIGELHGSYLLLVCSGL